LFFYFFILLFFLTSCGEEGDSFRIKGRFRNFNQGEFYIYCMDGVPRMDTIHVMDGRFAYETLITQPSTFVLRFPNSSEQAVFADQGAKVTIEGDASHLKEIEIKGTDDNEMLTDWRLHVANLTPPEVKKEAVSFIREHPDSRISNYLLTRYLVLNDEPDYKTASELAALMVKQQPDNGQLIVLEKKLRTARNSVVGAQLPAFTATATDGRKVSRQTMNADLNIISAWAMWSPQSMAAQRKLRQMQKRYGTRLSLLSINLDARPADIKSPLERDSITWPQVADGQLWETPLVGQLGISSVMGNIMFDRNGRVKAVNVPVDQLEQRLRELLK
ncbi:MAG: DUF4369 domain-containing protein, partial [Prevotella sp.]|nr:DUF4369 domain-containing protein [Prevotella sp.]